MNKEANMKTILDIAKECGATDCKDIADDGSIMLNPAQLTATIEAWNRQNSEPVGLFIAPDDYQGYTQVYKDYEGDADLIPLFTAPQQPPTSKELMDRIAELEKSLTESIDYIDSFRWHWMNVPSFGDRINKTIREAITQAHNPIFLAHNTMQNAFQYKSAKG